MIDRTKEFWTSDSPDDINEYLREYAENDTLDIKPVVCHSCGNTAFSMEVDQDECGIEVCCTKCGTKKLLLDGEEIWKDCEPVSAKCPLCRGKEYNVRIGFDRRENHNVRWVYVGNRCTKCEVLGSYLDWGIDYEPTTEMEQNI